MKNYRCFKSLKKFYDGGPFTVSSDGSFIACVCGDAINIVDSVDSTVKSTIKSVSDTLTALALSPDNKLLFSAGHSRYIRVWDLETLKCIRSWKGHNGLVMGMACNASGTLLATAGADRKVLVWDTYGGFCSHFFEGHKGVVTSILFHPDSKKETLFSGSDDATIRVWNLKAEMTGIKCIAILGKHLLSAVTSIAVSEDGCTLFSAGSNKVVKIWDLRSYTCKGTVATPEVLKVVATIHSGTPFASFVASVEQKGKKKDASLATHFITIGECGVVRIWNSEGSICLHEQKTRFTAAAMLHCELLCVTADQQFLFYSISKEGKESALVLNKRIIGYNKDIIDMKFLSDEEEVLAVATALEVRVYDVETMSCSYVLSGHKEVVLSLDTCTSSSGNVLILSGSKDKTIRLWNSTSKSCIGVGKGHNGDILAVAFAKKPYNFFVSGSGDGTLKIWSLDGISEDPEEPINLKTRSVVAAHYKDIHSVAVRSNNSLVCTGSEDRSASIWRLPDLVHVVTLKGHKRRVFSVEFAPVDPCVITASGDKTIKMWAISDGSCLKTFEGHTSSVFRASFITNGTQVVSCGADGLLKLWIGKTGECIATYSKHEDKVCALAVGKKTGMIATGGLDGVVNLWHDEFGKESYSDSDSDSDSSQKTAIGANNRNKNKEPNTVREQAQREIQQNQQRQAENEAENQKHLPPTDYRDGSTLTLNWVHLHPELLGAITDQHAERFEGQCWVLVLRAILQFMRNKDAPVQLRLNLDMLKLIQHMNSKKPLGKRTNISVTSMTKAMKYIYNTGLEKVGVKQGKIALTIKGEFISIKEATENDIVDKLRDGPVGILLDADDIAFDTTGKGIYVVEKTPRKTNHVLMIVGYGRWNGRYFFILQNTWGLGWGDKGYIRIVILETCSIFYLASIEE